MGLPKARIIRSDGESGFNCTYKMLPDGDTKTHLGRTGVAIRDTVAWMNDRSMRYSVDSSWPRNGVS